MVPADCITKDLCSGWLLSAYCKKRMHLESVCKTSDQKSFLISDALPQKPSFRQLDCSPDSARFTL